MIKKIKQWLKSRTIWWNTVFMPAFSTTVFMMADNMPLLRDNLGATYGICMFIIVMTSNYLRKITVKPLSEK